MLVGLDIGHDLSPDHHCQQFLFFVELGIVVITGPDGSGILGSVAGKPDVIAVFCRTGLSRDRSGSEVCCYSGSLGQHVFHGVGEKETGGLFEDTLFCGFCIIQHDPAFLINNLGIETGDDIFSSVRDCGVGGIEFDIAHAVSDSAKCQRLNSVGEDLSVDLFIVDKGIDAQFFSIVISDPGSDIRQGLDGDDVQGIADRGPDRLCAAVTAVPVVYLDAVAVIVLFVHMCGGEGITSSV